MTPQVVEVEPDAQHQLELTLAKHHVYRAEASAAAGRKQNVAGALSPLPGSIKVETNIAGARVSVDGEWMETPFTLNDVAAGQHDLVISPVLVDSKYYSCGGRFTVEVKPGEQAMVSRTLVPGTARLQITDAPPGSTAAIDGVAVDPSIFNTAVEVPAGKVDLVVTSPMQQTWRGSFVLSIGADERKSTVSLTTRLPRKTIAVGKADDLADVWPQWIVRASDLYPNQPGTQMTKVYLFRDDRLLYGRINFADGTPSPALSNGIARLHYSLRIWLPGNEIFLMQIMFKRIGKESPWIGICNPATRKIITTLSGDVKYSIQDSTLEFAMPIAPFRKFLAKGPYATDFSVASAGENGQWVSSTSTVTSRIDYSE